MQDENKTVKQVFYIDEMFLTDCAEKEQKGDYFKNSLSFFLRVKDKPVKDLSQSQKSWLYKLSGILQEKMKRQLQKPLYRPKVKKFAWLPKKLIKAGFGFPTIGSKIKYLNYSLNHKNIV